MKYDDLPATSSSSNAFLCSQWQIIKKGHRKYHPFHLYTLGETLSTRDRTCPHCVHVTRWNHHPHPHISTFGEVDRIVVTGSFTAKPSHCLANQDNLCIVGAEL